MVERDIARKLLELENLPTLPEIMGLLLETVAREDSSAEDVTHILERDVAISARILRLANSAFYGLRFKVDTIRKAVVVIGFDGVRTLALATAVFDTLAQRTQFAFEPREFWMHSLGTAKAAQVLAKSVSGVASPETCFTAGLLHDMGKYLLALALKEAYFSVVWRAENEHCFLHQVELEAMRTTHAIAGLWIAQKWRLPSVISDAIGYQYALSEYVGPHRREVGLVALASEIARAADFGCAGDFGPLQLEAPPESGLDIPIERIPQLLDEVKAYHDEAQSFLEALCTA